MQKMAKNWGWIFGIFLGIGPRVTELGAKMWSRMLYLSFQLSNWDEIWIVTLFLNCIATSNFEPMLQIPGKFRESTASMF